jgi:hypothetical protein
MATFSALELLVTVTVTSASTATSLALVWACVLSVVVTLLAVPPRLVPSIETVTVHVPDVERVVTLLIVYANGDLRQTR